MEAQVWLPRIGENPPKESMLLYWRTLVLPQPGSRDFQQFTSSAVAATKMTSLVCPERLESQRRRHE